MKPLIAFVLFLSLTLTTGCFKTTVVVSPDYDPTQEIPNVEELRLHLFDLIPLGSPIDMGRACPNGAGIVETRFLVTIEIISISQVRVYCNPSSADLDTTRPTLATISL